MRSPSDSMKILLVNPAPDFYTGTASASAPLGLLSIATYLNKYGHTASIYDRTIRHESLNSIYSERKPDIVGISFFSPKAIKDLLVVARFFHEKGIPVVLGGQMASASTMTDKIFETGAVDLISVGEGEQTWKELADTFENHGDISRVAGLIYQKGGKTIHTEERPFLDPAELPVIDWTLVDPNQYFQRSFGCKKMIYICSAKGCVGDCTFCINKAFHHCTYRRRPVCDVMDEIEYLIRNYDLDGVYFAAELFCKNRSEVYELCEEKRRRGLEFSWGFQSRIGIFKEEDFKYMYENGCRWAFFGVESGSKRILDEMGKHINLDLVKPTFDACYKAGIVSIASFIIANIGETYEDIRQTIDLALELEHAMYSFSCLAPCPGTELEWRAIEQYGYRLPEKLIDYTKKKFIDKPEPSFPTLPRRDMIVIREYFQWRSFTTLHPTSKENDRQTQFFFIKVILDALRTAFSNGFFGFFVYAFLSAKKFITTFYYANMCLGIRKKYGLYKKRK